MKHIFLNWKQNGSFSSVLSFLTDFKNNPNYNTVLFASFPYIQFASGKITVGAQNVSSFNNGSYTGEVGADMLQEMGAKYCLVGHSERRMLLNESCFQVNQKIAQLKKYNITPVLCIGETLEDRQEKKYLEKITKQMKIFTEGVIVAWEPCFSIGTGIIPTSAEILEVSTFIKQNYNTEILYGGSVNAKNAKEILNINNVNGVLIGGASLDVKQVNSIIYDSNGN